MFLFCLDQPLACSHADIKDAPFIQQYGLNKYDILLLPKFNFLATPLINSRIVSSFNAKTTEGWQRVKHVVVWDVLGIELIVAIELQEFLRCSVVCSMQQKYSIHFLLQCTLLDISFGPPKFCLYSNGAHAICFERTATSHDLFESLFSQLQNALSFDSKAHLRSRGHGKEKVHVF